MKARFGIAISLLVGSVLPGLAVETQPENLARKAKVSASSEYSERYLARFAIDGDVPDAMVATTSVDRVVCRKGRPPGAKPSSRSSGPRRSRLPSSSTSAARLCASGSAGRTTRSTSTTRPAPVAKGTFQMIHGPQRVKLPKTKVRRVTLKFLSSHGGATPGRPRSWRLPPARRRGTSLNLTRRQSSFPTGCRSIDRMLVIHRNELNPSHVYTYHAEGYRPGGGLYVFTPDARRPQARSSWSIRRTGRFSIAFSPTTAARCSSVGSGAAGEYQTQFDRTLPPDENPDHMYKIYRMNVDGTGLTCLTDGDVEQLQPLLAARRRHRLPLRPQAGVRLLLHDHVARALPHGPRRRATSSGSRPTT